MEQMQLRIEQNLLKTLFYRPEIIKIIKAFLPDIIPIENIPRFYQNLPFLNYLIKKGVNVSCKLKNHETEKNKQQMILERIIEEDNLELLEKESEKRKKMFLISSFLKNENVMIPILQYCIMKKAMKCFKFLMLNGADPSIKLYQESWKQKYKWDCISIAVFFGEWEMMKILEERGINKLNNPNVWEAAALTHRNKLLKLLLSNKDQISNFEECLNKGLKEAVKGNNLKGLRILISKGAEINAQIIIYQNIKKHFEL